MNDLYCHDKTKGIEEIINSLVVQYEYYKSLYDYTSEFKRMLLEGGNEDVLKEKIQERGSLINKLILSKEHYNSIKDIPGFTDNTSRQQVNDLLQQIQQEIDATISLNEEISSILKEYIKEINCNLEKIQEGKYLINNLKNNAGNLPAYIDVSG